MVRGLSLFNSAGGVIRPVAMAQPAIRSGVVSNVFAGNNVVSADGIDTFIKRPVKPAEEISEAYFDKGSAADMLINTVMKLKNPYTREHCLAVAECTRKFTQYLGRPSSVIKKYSLGAAIHDVGKLAVPLDTLTGQALTKEQFETDIKPHTTNGYNMVKGMPGIPDDVAKIVLQHHECWNGSGYPFGLKGDQISEGAQFVSMSDAYCAMSENRSYRKALPKSEVRERLLAGAGKQWNPALVKKFVDII